MQNPSLYVFVKFQQHLEIVAKSVMIAETPRWSVWCVVGVDGNRVLWKNKWLCIPSNFVLPAIFSVFSLTLPWFHFYDIGTSKFRMWPVAGVYYFCHMAFICTKNESYMIRFKIHSKQKYLLFVIFNASLFFVLFFFFFCLSSHQVPPPPPQTQHLYLLSVPDSAINHWFPLASHTLPPICQHLMCHTTTVHQDHLL